VNIGDATKIRVVENLDPYSQNGRQDIEEYAFKNLVEDQRNFDWEVQQ